MFLMLSSFSRAVLFSLRSNYHGNAYKLKSIRATTPGFYTPQLWRTQREESENLGRQLFPRQRSVDQNTFLDQNASVVLLGQEAENVQVDVFDRFNELDLDDKLRSNLDMLSVDRMTHVQKHSISLLSVNDDRGEVTDPVIGKYDLMSAAQTGSGKTLAYLVPAVQRLLTHYPRQAMNALQASGFEVQFPSFLVLVPTRELAQQVNRVICQLAFRTRIRSLALFGGERPNRQQNLLSSGCHALVATPGRLNDFLNQGLLRLDHCRGLVLDEADRMLDMGFEPQIRAILESPEYGMPQPSNDVNCRQTTLFSATFPREVAFIARDFLRGPRCLSLSVSYHQDGQPEDSEGQSINRSHIIVPEWGRAISQEEEARMLESRIPTCIRQEVRMCLPHPQAEHFATRPHRRYWLASVLQIVREVEASAEGEQARILVFCNSKAEVDSLDRGLYAAGLRSCALHGDKSQRWRTRACDQFRRGTVNVLVATSVAARGLDFPDVRAVINAGLPLSVDDYVHRIGRTGRQGRSGLAITLFDPVSEARAETTARPVGQALLRFLGRSRQEGPVAAPPEFVDFVRVDTWRPKKPSPQQQRRPRRHVNAPIRFH